ncbi:alpha/beta hydrolase [Chloroflexota bacterium]
MEVDIIVTKVVALELDDLMIAGKLYLPGNQAAYPTVCVCHGIPAKSPDPNDRGYPLLAERICREGFAVFIFNFRGTGASGGNFDILGWTRDMKAAIDYLCTLPEVDKARLSLLGFSGGAAVLIYGASRDRRVSAVVTCASPAEFTFFTGVDDPSSIIEHFRRIGAIRDKDFPQSTEDWLGGFRSVNPIKYVAGIAPRPLLLVHGSRDETVEVSHAHRLFDKAGEPKQIIIVEGAGHRLRHDDRAMAIVIDWLKSHARIST